MKFVNSPLGKQYNLRGINTKVVQARTIRRGDMVCKLNLFRLAATRRGARAARFSSGRG
jgi:hypothetical protein